MQRQVERPTVAKHTEGATCNSSYCPNRAVYDIFVGRMKTKLCSPCAKSLRSQLPAGKNAFAGGKPSA